MREIKFRAWDKKRKFIFRVTELVWDFLSKVEIKDRTTGFVLKENDYDLMQYTGLKDKNGKEIYEGDILSYGMWSDDKGSCIYKVYWNEEDALFDTLDLRHNQEMTHVETFGAEIIGNIYENPELVSK